MALSTFVKVGGVTNLSDARYCAGMGVDLLGFNVEEGTEGYVNPEKFSEITGWLAGVSYCAEIGQMLPPAALLQSFKNAGIDYVESTSPEILEALEGFTRILSVDIRTEEDLADLYGLFPRIGDSAEYLLVTGENRELNESLTRFLEQQNNIIRILRGYDLTPENVLHPEEDFFFGLALKGSEEIKPGYKDFDELAEILEAIETD